MWAPRWAPFCNGIINGIINLLTRYLVAQRGYLLLVRDLKILGK